ncbi:centrosomal protein kizuna isoform X2 [Engraulis encrasicolus]|uniref:centrosomal protein kizuna isoform X2 n=1 Tax=Engraulis encrasicolus TaxID=184585 RepID=UPI002FD2B084
MAFCNDEYFEKIGRMQKNIHELEKKRLALERDLFTYCRSDQRVAQLKHAKFQQHLKEISRKEEQAKVRNLEYLRYAEAVVPQAAHCYPDLSSLHQMKAECWKQLCKLRENQSKQRTGLQNKNKHLAASSKNPPMAQPSVIFMGRQTIRDPASDPVTSVLSPSLSHSPPNHRPQPLLPSGLLKDACASKASVGPVLSDDILDSIQLPTGNAPSGGHERSMPGVPSDCNLSARATEAPTEATPRVTLRGPPEDLIVPPVPTPSAEDPQGLERSSPSPPLAISQHSHQHHHHHHSGSSSLNDPPEDPSESGLKQEGLDGTLDCSQEFRVEDLEKVPEAARSRTPSISSSTISISPDSSENIDDSLSISISDRDLQKSVKTKSSGQKLSKKHSALPEEDKISATLAQATLQDDSDPSSHSSVTDRLSLDGLSYLLDHIEDRLYDGDEGPYRNLTVSQQKLSHVISLCRGKATAGSLNGEALGVCGAVALQLLWRLSRSTSKGCLLPPELEIAGANGGECGGERRAEIRCWLPADARPLWERWLSHVLLLRDRQVMTPEEILQVFTPALLQPHASYTHKAEVILRGVLNEHPVDVASTLSDNADLSSASLPSILGDGSDAQPSKPATQRSVAGLAAQGVQSAEEDSADQGSLESIPIRETKAYQLLKQSATHDQRWSRMADTDDEEEEEEMEGEGEEEDDRPSQPPQEQWKTREKHTLLFWHRWTIKEFAIRRQQGRQGDRGSQIEANQGASLAKGKHSRFGGGKDTSTQDSFRKEKTKAEALTAVQSKAFWGESDDSNSDIEIALRPRSWKSSDDTDDFYD